MHLLFLGQLAHHALIVSGTVSPPTYCFWDSQPTYLLFLGQSAHLLIVSGGVSPPTYCFWDSQPTYLLFLGESAHPLIFSPPPPATGNNNNMSFWWGCSCIPGWYGRVCSACLLSRRFSRQFGKEYKTTHIGLYTETLIYILPDRISQSYL